MATAKKLPSGSWRCQVFSHYEYIIVNGKTKKKRVYESFTSNDPTKDGKKEAELMAAIFAAEKECHRYDKMSVKQAIEGYIATKSNILSPSTIRSYKSLQNNAYTAIETLQTKQLNNSTIQKWLNEYSVKHSPKTVRNAYGLLSAVLEMYKPDIRLKVKMPAKKRSELYTPSDDDIKQLLNHISGTELEIAVMLSAFCTLRRGEICALQSSDLHENMLEISKSMVMDTNRNWHIKQPKTDSSYRTVPVPDFLVTLMNRKEGRIINATPEQISNRFRRAIKYSGCPHFRFHDLRHYSASILHAIGVKDQYIMDWGGWKTDNVMKSVYRNVIDLEKKKQQKKVEKYFKSMQHEMQHEKEKVP